MAIFEMGPTDLCMVPKTTFAQEKLTERGDLQRLLQRSISYIAPDTMVLTDEFGAFEGSLRRVDLLAIDKNAQLVVIELKRTEDGGHLELQAIRYAAMVSAMKFQDAVDAHRRYLEANGRQGEDAYENIIGFLGPDAEPVLSEPVRIVLASADFSKEVTTSVLWLNASGLDITCVRMRPHRLEAGRILLDIQQVIPLPEAAEYTIKIQQKAAAAQAAARSQKDHTRFDATIGGVSHQRLTKRHLVFHAVAEAIAKGISPAELRQLIQWRQIFFHVPSEVDSDGFLAAFRAAGKKEPKRYFFADGQLFHVDGETYALSNQWGDRSLEAIDLIKARLGAADSINYAPAVE